RQASTAPVHRSLTVSDFLRRPSVGASMTSFSLKDTLVPDSPTLIEAVDGDPEWTAPTVHGNADSGIPVCITRPVGDGLAVYLNFSVEPYLRLRHDTDGLPLRLAAQDIVQRLGKVTALADVVRTESGFIHDRAFDNLPEIGHQCHPFRDGALQYLGILWDYKRADWGPYDAEVRFNTPAHVYDVRAGRYHGFTDTVRMQVEGCPAKLFALLPYQVSGVSIDGPVETRPGTAVEFELAVRTDAETLGTHTLRMTVRDGDGNELPAWTETLRAPAGKTTYTMLPAFDQSGETLTLQVRDVATGATDSVKLEVR
ncbi:MAG: hypothetical protein K9N51_09755, partial [Candidatus Pacebacteria bacterium]|nr:hypothetical protein [Candidatus Paceibacterota bacterium]